jgi:hypothetical protein
MNIFRYYLTATLCLLAPFALADKLFISNNTGTITAGIAYGRLIGPAQQTLKNTLIPLLQNKHYEHGTIKSGLGAYTMQDSNTLTADNTLVFTTSPQQNIADQTLIQTAADLAYKLNQESVAVFINKQQTAIDVTIRFTGAGIPYKKLQHKLTELSTHHLGAFTLYFKNHADKLNAAKVTAAEWLTTADRLPYLKQLFANESFTTNMGQALLVFKDAHCESIRN